MRSTFFIDLPYVTSKFSCLTFSFVVLTSLVARTASAHGAPTLSATAGTFAAGEHRRDYKRHWTPVHLDFTVEDIRPMCTSIEEYGGCVEAQSLSEQADIAHCADPFGNGFCVIRE